MNKTQALGYHSRQLIGRKNFFYLKGESEESSSFEFSEKEIINKRTYSFDVGVCRYLDGEFTAVILQAEDGRLAIADMETETGEAYLLPKYITTEDAAKEFLFGLTRVHRNGYKRGYHDHKVEVNNAVMGLMGLIKPEEEPSFVEPAPEY
ncbi:hypothetical protein QX249_10905 [Vibrio parahaemolyticus]|uniref:DUF4313 domain-containing protein n=1 Tax=Vibrio parahaemolyticus TaxID=670 RepID=A0AAW8PY70_VIBPH|nr:hypothetical protein [Vibrio parahaemolyticus]MDS1821171.1 hypothetical protein [Vibrio parahaemolyticus]